MIPFAPRIVLVNLAWHLGHNRELLAHACADADVVIVVEALAKRGRVPARLGGLLPEGWATSQDTSSAAKAGSAVCWRTDTMRRRDSGLERLSRVGLGVRSRHLNHALLEHSASGDVRRYGGWHAPLRPTGRQGEFYRNLSRWLARHPHAVTGGDANRRPRFVQGATGRRVAGHEVMALAVPGDLRIVTESRDRRVRAWTDHPIITVLLRPKRNPT